MYGFLLFKKAIILKFEILLRLIRGQPDLEFILDSTVQC